MDRDFVTVNILQRHVRTLMPQQSEAYQAYADAERMLGLDPPESISPMKGYEHIRWGRKSGTFVDAGGTVRTIPNSVEPESTKKFIPAGIAGLDADEQALTDADGEEQEIVEEDELIDAETDIAVDADSDQKDGTDECE